MHFHGLCNLYKAQLVCPERIWKRDDSGNLRYVPNSLGYLDWPAFSSRFGYFSCSFMRDKVRCAHYVSKYITKDLATWGKGVQLVLKSKGLQMPELVYADDTSALLIPADACDNIYCRSGWADETHTKPYTQKWIYEGAPIVDLSTLQLDDAGCLPGTYEQLTLL